MRYLCLSIFIFLLAACHPSRDQQNAAAYDVITQKCYVLRLIKPAAGDTAAAAAQQQQQEIITYLEQHQFTRHVAGRDSLLFRRANGQEVIIELAVPQDAWEAHTLIVFDPEKNPLFVNLHKGTGQIDQYIKSK
jgi:hypothetical protein